ncbi:hypothetical protein V1292_003683 [Bradyrhizobium sp. AZCC 1719]
MGEQRDQMNVHHGPVHLNRFNRAGPQALRSDTVLDRLLGFLRDEFLEPSFDNLVILVRVSCHSRKL